MLESLSLAGLSAGAHYLVKEVVGPLAKGAAEDFCKDFLKQCVSDGLAQAAPGALKKAIAQSLKEFLVLFQGELENCGWPGQLAEHEFAAPLKRLLKDAEIRQFLGEAFDTDTPRLDDSFLAVKWTGLGCDSLPADFDWAQLTKNYVRRVKGLIKADAELSRQLQLDYEARTAANTAEILGVRVNFDLKQYQETLKEKFGSLSLDSLDTTGAAYDGLRLWKIFVAQDVRECAAFAPQMYELPKERLRGLQAAGEIDVLLSADILEQQRQSYTERPVESVRGVVGLNEPHSALRAVMLGDPGSGKSTLLRAIALNWAEKSGQALAHEPIPILIELRLYAQDKDAGKCNSFLEYLHKGNTACHLNQIELDELLKKGRARALFDGVDEVFDPQLREAVVNDIHRFSNSYPQVQMVVTSRWLGYKAETLRKAEFMHYMLQDLNAVQIEDFVARWHDLTFTAAQAEDRARKLARLQKAVAESKPIRELAGNPLLLTMMAILNRNQELPRDRARLYERASEVLLHQWDVEVKLHEQADLKNWQVDVRDKQAMLRKVAHHMQANEDGLSGNVISRADLEKILTEYLKTLEVDRARAVAKIMIEQLRERNFILCYLGADNYAFVHRTFLEYFCASEFVHRFEKERTLEPDALKSLYGEHFQDEAWDEVLRLMAGMLEPRFVGEIIEHLLEQQEDLEVFARFEKEVLGKISYYLSPVVLSNLLLAADCFAEARTRPEISNSASILLTQLKGTVKDHSPYVLGDDAAKALIDAISNHWAEKPDTLPWLKSRAQDDKNEAVRCSAVSAIAQGWKDAPDTLPWLKSRAQDDNRWAVKSVAFQAIAQGWKDDPDTLPWLKSYAQDDKNEDVRYVAVSAIAQGWKTEPDTLLWLKSRAEDDKNDDVRGVAVKAIAQGWKDDPDTLPWLKLRAQDDEIGIHNTAIEVIAKGWKDDPDTLTWLKLRAQNNVNENVRGVAVRTIAKGWKSESNTLPWLKLCAQNDVNENVRGVAVRVIAQGWKDEPDTLSWLKSRAQNDVNENVRSVAVSAITQGWRENTDLFEFWCDCTLQASFQSSGFFRENLRQTALQILVQQYPEHPKTKELLCDRAQNDNDEKFRTWATEQLSQLT